jgi:hypothetical protein
MRVLTHVRLIAAFVFYLLAAVPSSAQKPPTDALQLDLVRDAAAQSGRPLFKVEFHNKTTGSLILDLGLNLAGKKYAGEITFLLTDERGRMRHLLKRDPMEVAGAMGPYIVTIPGGRTFELPAIDLVDYWSYEPKITVLALPAGRYSLTAEYRGRNPNDDFAPAPGRPAARQYA